MAALVTWARDAVGAFFRWWLSELAVLVPRQLRQLLFPPPTFLLVDPADAHVALWLLRGSRANRLKSISLEGKATEAVRESIGQQVRSMDLKSAVTVLRLPASQGLRYRLTLPAAAEQDLRSALALQVDRRTPFALEDAAFDYSVVARDRQSKQIIVEITVAPQRTIEDIRKRCTSWGLAPEIVDLAEDGAEVGPPRHNLIVDLAEPEGHRPWRLLSIALGVLAAILLAAAVYLPVRQDRMLAVSLLVQVAEAKSAADEVLRLRGEIEARQTEARFFAKLKTSAPPKVQILDEVTRILPDDTWLHRLSINQREVQISGSSPTASRLVGLIDGSDLFGTPRFLSTVTNEPGSGLENFKLVFELESLDRVTGQ